MIGYSLTAVREEDFVQLCRWRNDSVFQKFCGQQRNQLTVDEFRSELRACVSRGRHWQSMIRNRLDESVGTIYSYEYSKRDKYCFTTIYLDHTAARSGIGVYATLAFTQMLYSALALYKIYFDVHEYNGTVVSMLKRVGLPLEGRFAGHRLLEGSRYDTLRFALYANHLPSLLDRYQRRDRNVFQVISKRERKFAAVQR